MLVGRLSIYPLALSTRVQHLWLVLLRFVTIGLGYQIAVAFRSVLLFGVRVSHEYSRQAESRPKE